MQTKILWHECYLQYDEFVFVHGEVRGVDFETVDVEFEVFIGALQKKNRNRKQESQHKSFRLKKKKLRAEAK